jgi:predicted transcriptional regulator
MSDQDRGLNDSLQWLSKMREYRETIEQMRRDVKSGIGRLSGLTFTSYEDAMEWLADHNATRITKDAQ